MEELSGFRTCHIAANRPGDILHEQRVIQNMTQTEVAKKANITLQQYQKFEKNNRNIRTASFQLACSVLKALNMDIDRFYSGGYTIGEEVYLEAGKVKYVKTGKDINEDVNE